MDGANAETQCMLLPNGKFGRTYYVHTYIHTLNLDGCIYIYIMYVVDR